MEANNRKSVFTELKPFDIYSLQKDDFMEVTEWHNGEGITLNVHCSLGNRSIELTYGQIKAFKECLKFLKKM